MGIKSVLDTWFWKRPWRPNANAERTAELILSEITIMGQGYCVIGLERVSPGSFRSVRPRPPRGFAWREPFHGKRGDSVLAHLTPVPGAKPPHTEDHQSQGLKKTDRTLDGAQLVSALKHAEVARGLEEMFGCAIVTQNSRGNGWIPSGQGSRSICGCEVKNIRFRIFEDPGRVSLRAQLVCPSGERLETLPVVDREWVALLHRLMDHFKDQQAAFRAARFLNGPVRRELMNSPNLFARIGLARGMQDEKCWLMLDSLFPQPKDSWFDMLKGE